MLRAVVQRGSLGGQSHSTPWVRPPRRSLAVRAESGASTGRDAGPGVMQVYTARRVSQGTCRIMGEGTDGPLGASPMPTHTRVHGPPPFSLRHAIPAGQAARLRWLVGDAPISISAE